MSSFLLLKQYPACYVNLIRIVVRWEVGGRIRCCFSRYCTQDLFKTTRSILVLFPSSFFSMCSFSIHVVHPCSSIDTAIAWKKSRLVLSGRFDLHMIDNLLLVFHAFTCVSWYPFQLMRCCCRGTWTGLLIFEACHLQCRWFIFVSNT